ncbi:DUF881 domain-containing protein [Actinoplanes sp. NPDC049316]|uniref:DUF881 domain-containing protein n=1 Tax=Actinoplanes sp. NPDC049316 TaxID=3154727 RepID=UPI0034430789
MTDDEKTARIVPPGDEASQPGAGAREVPIEADGPTVRLTPPTPPPPADTAPAERPPAAVPAADAEPAVPAADAEPAVAAEAQPGGEPTTSARAAAVPEKASAGEPARTQVPDPDGPGAVSPEKVSPPDAAPAVAPWRRLSSAGALIWVLLALFGFTLVVQLRSNDADSGLASARQEDLVRILSDLEARDQRLQQEINGLEESQRQLTSGVAGRQAALAEAEKRADELGLLSGTLPARGPGLKISIDPKGQPIKASAILNAVQELRGAQGEVMELVGGNGVTVRIVASSYFVDAAGGEIIVDGKQLSGPYTLWVIGVPSTMQTALQIPGGVVESVRQAGGNVTMEQRAAVDVTAVRQPASLQYARPVS